MKILFLSIGNIPSINSHEIYPDLLREFKKRGDTVYIVCCKNSGDSTEWIDEGGSYLLKVRVANLKQSGFLKKGISTILLPYLYRRAIQKHLAKEKFDLILYSTPPITIHGLVRKLKKSTETVNLLQKKIYYSIIEKSETRNSLPTSENDQTIKGNHVRGQLRDTRVFAFAIVLFVLRYGETPPVYTP